MATYHENDNPSTAAAVDPSGSRRRGNPFKAALPWLITGVVLVLGGFCWGYSFRDSRKLSAEELRRQEQQELSTAGWTSSADGVLTRWCTEECHPPRLYGGGKAQILEVYCKDRPCGNIRASFEVLNRQGQAIGTTTASKEGLQGERLRLVAVSPEPAAERFKLQQFTAQAMVY